MCPNGPESVGKRSRTKGFRTCLTTSHHPVGKSIDDETLSSQHVEFRPQDVRFDHAAVHLETNHEGTKRGAEQKLRNKVVKFVCNGLCLERMTEGRQRLCPVLRARWNQSLHFVTSACTKNRRLTRSIRIAQQQLVLLVDKVGLSLRLSEDVLMSVGAVGLGQRNRRTAILIPGEREIEARVRKMVSSQFASTVNKHNLSLSLPLYLPLYLPLCASRESGGMYSLGGGRRRRRRTLQCASRLKAHTVLGEVARQFSAADRELALGVPSLTLARAGFAGVDALLLAGALDVWVAVALRDVVDAVFVKLQRTRGRSVAVLVENGSEGRRQG
jgi:hypothetical protein